MAQALLFTGRDMSTCVEEEEENMFILQDVPRGKPGYRRLFV
jgi:hypothetical protein